MDLDSIENPEHREFMRSLFGALRTDFPDRTFDLRLAYSSGYGPSVGYFVRPRFVVRDTTERPPLSVLEIGDGVLQSEKARCTGHRDIKYFLQRLGHPPKQPDSLGRIDLLNRGYFFCGEKSRDVFSKFIGEGALHSSLRV